MLGGILVAISFETLSGLMLTGEQSVDGSAAVHDSDLPLYLEIAGSLVAYIQSSMTKVHPARAATGRMSGALPMLRAMFDILRAASLGCRCLVIYLLVVLMVIYRTMPGQRKLVSTFGPRPEVRAVLA